MSFHDEPFVPNPGASDAQQQREYAEYLRNQRELEEEYRRRQREREELTQFAREANRRISREDGGAARDENGVFLDPRTGLPAASAANTLAFRFQQRLAEVVNNAEGTNIFSFFDFNKVANDPDEYVENTIQPRYGGVDAGYGDQGILDIEIPFRGNINDLNNIIAIRLFSQRENFDDPKSEIKILVSVENERAPRNSENKYLVSRFNLNDAYRGPIFLFPQIAYIAKEIQGISYASPEYERQVITLNFYAQGVNTTEIFDMHSITFTIPRPANF